MQQHVMLDDTERDFRGYGATPPDPRWPGGARVAININLNYEGGGEHSLLEGDSGSEGMLTDIGFPAYEGLRSPIVESAFEYGSRCGVWRLLRIFARFDIAVSVLGVVRALRAIRRPRRPWSRPATRSSATATAGSIITAFPKRSSATISPGRWPGSPG
jgi:hypothetical protein